MLGMRKPVYVRNLTEDERRQLEEGLCSSDAFKVRRCQMVLASDTRPPVLVTASRALV